MPEVMVNRCFMRIGDLAGYIPFSHFTITCLYSGMNFDTSSFEIGVSKRRSSFGIVIYVPQHIQPKVWAVFSYPFQRAVEGLSVGLNWFGSRFFCINSAYWALRCTKVGVIWKNVLFSVRWFYLLYFSCKVVALVIIAISVVSVIIHSQKLIICSLKIVYWLMIWSILNTLVI